MSIPLDNSPFRYVTPCKYARETEEKQVSCYLNNKKCDYFLDCEFFKPLEEFNDLATDSNLVRLNNIASWVEDHDFSSESYEIVCSNCHHEIPKSPYGNDYYSNYCPNCGKMMYWEDKDCVDTGIYKHFKGNYYQVLCVAKSSEDDQMFVIYQALYGNCNIYARPLSMFKEIIEDYEYKYRGPRFYKVDNMEGST